MLSEGLNLQDCDKIINYDLHWNPVRLIQRFGRIDRIGSEHDSIYGYNFLPERELEKHLGSAGAACTAASRKSTTPLARTRPSWTGERLNEEAMYAIYGEGEIGHYEEDGVDEFVDLNEAEEIIRQLRESQPELVRPDHDLRDGVRCGGGQVRRSTVVLCRAGNYKQLYQVDEAGQVVSPGCAAHPERAEVRPGYAGRDRCPRPQRSRHGGEASVRS